MEAFLFVLIISLLSWLVSIAQAAGPRPCFRSALAATKTSHALVGRLTNKMVTSF